MSFHINSPLPSSLASECRKAARILNSFVDPGRGVDIIIPPDILDEAKGFAIFTVLKAGFLFSGRAGSGLVVARLPDGSWSAPAAIMTGGMGFGGQVGAELTDFVMVLNTTAAVKTFMHHGSITLGGNISVAAGPVGRNAEASGTASIKNVAAVYSYSKTRGLFAGVSLEGSVILERFDANAKMYGRKVSVRELLNGSVSPPPQADVLYQALSRRVGSHDGRYDYTDAYGGSYTHNRESPYGSQFNDEPSAFSRGTVRQAATGGGGFGSYNTGNYRSTGYEDRYTSSYRDQYEAAPTPPPERNSTGTRARALFNFAGEQDGDLPFKKGDIISIVKKSDTQQDWWTGRIGAREGIFPANFVELL